MMESEFERILKNEKKALAASPGVLLFVGVTMFLFGVVPIWLRVSGLSVPGAELAWILAAFLFIAYYQTRQSRVNLELVKAIEEIRTRLDNVETTSDHDT